MYFAGSDSDQPKRKRSKKNARTKKEKSRKGTVENLRGKIKSKETISTSESDSDTGDLKIASG